MITRPDPFKLLYFLILIILFNSCNIPNEVSAWEAVDSNSIFILESKNAPEFPEKEFKPFLKKADLYLSSVQKSSNDSFDICYSYLMERNIYDSILIFQSWPKDQKITNRLLNGFEIHEIKNKTNDIQLAFTYLRGIFVLSKSSILIENAIRVFEKKEKRSFKTNKALFQFPSLKSDQGNVYINIDNFSDISFSESSLIKSIPLLNEFRNLSVYDIRSNGGFLSLNGFSLGDNSSLALFQKQKPVTFKVAKYIPNYSTGLVHFGISDFYLFKEITDSLFFKRFNIGNEIAFISEKDKKSLIAFVEFKPGSTTDWGFITAYQEMYSNYQIRSVNGDALKKEFGKIFPNAPFSFSTIKDNYLFLSQSIEEMKSLIDAIENDDTWGKTLEYQKFSETGLQECNVTLIFKEPDFFSKDTGVLNGYPALMDSLGLSKVNWASMQMSALDNHFYSSINFSLGSTSLRSSKGMRNTQSSSIHLSGDVQFVSLVKNHITGLQEILVQDSDLTLYLISLNEGIIWKRQVDSQIQESLSQLDYFKNGKLQYLFSSKNKLYVIDRLGRDVTGFPKALPSIARFSDVVDYDKSKNYRFVISSLSNEVYLFDKKGNNLIDWGPKKFDREIARVPQHFKIGGKDHFIIILTDGTIQIFNRKGDRINLFKTSSNETFSGDFCIESGMTHSDTYLHYLSSEGAVVKQNLSGNILSSENLLRGKNSKFVLRRVKNRDGFYMYRTDIDKIIVFDQQGKIVFEKQNSGSANLDFQCIEVENNKMVFGFYDAEQKLFQVFDESGFNLTKTPLESDLIPVIGFGKSKDELVVYSFSKSSVFFNPIKR